MTTLISTTTILAMLAGVGPAQSEPAEREVRLEIDGSRLLDEQIASATEDTLFFVRSDSTKVLSEAHRVRVVDDQATPAVLVSLSWVSYPDSVYGVRLEVRRPGEEARLVESFECSCVDSELTAAIIARLPAVLEQLEAHEPVPAEPEPGESDPGSEHPAVAAPQGPEDRGSAPLSATGKAGIGLLSGGAVAVVTGGIVFAAGERFDPPIGRVPDRHGRNFEPPGVALMVSGGAALLTGAVLIAIDRTRARKRVSALLLPSPGGLAITGRF